MILNIGDIQHIEHELDSGHEFPFHEYEPEDFIETIRGLWEEIERSRILASQRSEKTINALTNVFKFLKDTRAYTEIIARASIKQSGG